MMAYNHLRTWVFLSCCQFSIVVREKCQSGLGPSLVPGAANKGSKIGVFLIVPDLLLLQHCTLITLQLLGIPKLTKMNVQAD